MYFSLPRTSFLDHPRHEMVVLPGLFHDKARSVKGSASWKIPFGMIDTLLWVFMVSR